MISTTAHLTLDEFMRLYDEEGPFELINGERIAVSPTKLGHSYTANWLTDQLNRFAVPHRLGRAFNETPFILVPPDDPNWVKGSFVPDVMFVRADRLIAYRQANPDWKEQPMALVPDLVVEIISPTDRYADVDDKVAQYLKEGVNLIWVLNPRRRTVTIHEAGSNQQTTLTDDQMLTGGQLIPGFEVKVAAMFDSEEEF
ncbi:MAG: Uma2 family endonuclease [Anaerolineae bacterium]|nr:Uma2 family endonuclease [Anaerolineae bacterium]